MTPEEQITKSNSMFGVPSMSQWFHDGFHGLEEITPSAVQIMAISQLSDAQEEMSMGMYQAARQSINRAKWIIMEKLK